MLKKSIVGPLQAYPTIEEKFIGYGVFLPDSCSDTLIGECKQQNDQLSLLYVQLILVFLFLLEKNVNMFEILLLLVHVNWSFCDNITFNW
jgi:hypothetical protein